jgi:hypothetical protein
MDYNEKLDMLNEMVDKVLDCKETIRKNGLSKQLATVMDSLTDALDGLEDEIRDVEPMAEAERKEEEAAEWRQYYEQVI